MGLTVARCPACGASLDLETDRDYFFCPHCGSKVIQQDEKIVIEHVIRKVDEAKVKQAEVMKAEVEAKTEQDRIQAENLKFLTKIMLSLIFVMGIISVLMFNPSPIVIIGILVAAGIFVYKYFVPNKKPNNRNDEEN